MAVWLRLLDHPYAELAGERFELAPHKPVCLLVYLGFHRTWVNREVLAALFWPEKIESRARHNLRMLLARARRLPFAAGLEVEAERLRWSVESDVNTFREAVTGGRWSEAIDAYRHPLLHSWRISDAAGFEAWLDLEREALAASWSEAVRRRSHVLTEQHDHHHASELLRMLLVQDPLAEDVLVAYVKSAYLSGDRDEALKAYERFRRTLKTELGYEPMQATRDLVDTIGRGGPVDESDVAKGVESSSGSRIPITVLKPPSLVGRTSELAAVAGATTPVVLIGGAAGIGKTRLVTEVAPPATSNWLHCREGLENIPYYPVTEHVRRRLDSLPDLGYYRHDLARLVPELLPDLSPVPPEPHIAKARLTEGLALLLEAEAEPMVIEDLQWADQATMELISVLAVRRRIRIFGTYRSDELTPALASMVTSLRSSRVLQEVHLHPLSPVMVRRLLSSLNGFREGHEQLGRWLAQRSGGNPFFALETLKALFESGALTDHRGGWQVHDPGQGDHLEDEFQLLVPAGVAELISKRLSRLSEAARRVVEVASVFREGFSPKLLARIVGLSEWGVTEALEEAESGGLLSHDSFPHDLVRQSIYTALSGARRSLVHLQLAEALEAAAEPMVVARHFHEAGEVVRAGEYRLRAAEGYLTRGLHEEALLALAQAVEFAADTATRERIEARQAFVLVELGRTEQAETLVSQLLERCEDPRARSDALYAFGRLLLEQGKVSPAAEVATELEKLDVGRTEQDHVNLAKFRALVAQGQNDYQGARVILEGLVERLRRQPPSVDLVEVLTSLGAALDSMGLSQDARPLHREALDVGKAIGARHLQIVVTNNMLWSATQLGSLGEILPEAETALALGEYAATMTLRNNVAAIYVSLGRHAEACRHYENITGQSKDPTLLCVAWGRLATLYHQLGSPQPAKEALRQGIALLPQSEFLAAHVRVGLAALHYGTDEQVAQVRPFLAGKTPVEPHLEQELREALVRRGLTYPVPS